MKQLTNFIGLTLTKSEMKKVIGGGCAVCSSHSNDVGSGTCGSYSFTSAQAESMALENDAAGDDGYNYYVSCEG